MLNSIEAGPREAGGDHITPVLLLHGFWGGSAYWAPLMADLAMTRRVVAPDLPGFAGSADAPVPEGVPGIADAVFATMDALRLDRVALLGHSLGGMVALQMALDRPERVERLVIYASAATGRMPNRPESYAATIARIESGGVDGAVAPLIRSWFVAGDAAPLVDLCKRAGAGANPDTAIALYRALPDWSVKERLAEIGARTLVIVGDRDRQFALEELLTLFYGIPEARLSVLPGCAHMAHLERPSMFSLLLRDFLDLGW